MDNNYNDLILLYSHEKEYMEASSNLIKEAVLQLQWFNLTSYAPKLIHFFAPIMHADENDFN